MGDSDVVAAEEVSVLVRAEAPHEGLVVCTGRLREVANDLAIEGWIADA